MIPYRSLEMSRATRWLRIVLISAATLWLATDIFWMGIRKNFAIDEFQYAHAAWEIFHGAVPYRDFFEVHFPLTYQIMSIVFSWTGDRPEAILHMRYLMLPWIILQCVAVWILNRRYGRSWALFGPLILLCTVPLWVYGHEIRHDPISLTLLLCSFAFLSFTPRWPRACAFLSGVAFSLCLWGTQKAILYAGSIYFCALLIDLWINRRQRWPCLLVRPLIFLAGATSVALLIAIDLSVDNNWGSWWKWCFVWAEKYQREYPPFSWIDHFLPMLRDCWWYFPVAGIGVHHTFQRLIKQQERSSLGADHLLLGALLSTFLSFALQQAPWGYSAIPFWGILSIFTTRGIIIIYQQCNRESLHSFSLGQYFQMLFSILLIFVVHRHHQRYQQRVRKHDNVYQLKTLRQVDLLTTTEDRAYDNSGGYVARHHSYFYFYTEGMTRSQMGAQLIRDVPQAIRKNQTPLVLHDIRFNNLPRRLKQFFRDNFQKYNGDIWLWGKSFQTNHHRETPLITSFEAIKDGQYFISPPQALQSGELNIDGNIIESHPFYLSKGAHQITYRGTISNFFILWLPRNGEQWTPQPNATPRFSAL